MTFEECYLAEYVKSSDTKINQTPTYVKGLMRMAWDATRANK